jgi:hypothetical protein
MVLSKGGCLPKRSQSDVRDHRAIHSADLGPFLQIQLVQVGLSVHLTSLLVMLAEEKHLLRHAGRMWMRRKGLPEFSRDHQRPRWIAHLTLQLDGSSEHRGCARIAGVLACESREGLRRELDVRERKQTLPVHGATALCDPCVQRVRRGRLLRERWTGAQPRQTGQQQATETCDWRHESIV